jgi:CubicO group peptidase (beta-lactamase class C family)
VFNHGHDRVYQEKDMTEAHGFCDERFTAVREAFSNNLASGADLGASCAVSWRGEMVVDLWGGYLNEEKTTPWQENTIVNVYSTTKTMSFLCALLLADRGELDFDANVADYWPEFAANGKENVKVWHCMDHAAGLSGIDEPMSAADLYDWDKVCAALAAQAPWWEPGTASGYHAMTQGFLIGEIVRRITDKTLGAFFRDEVTTKLGADFYIGVPESEFPRIGDLIPPQASRLAGDVGGSDSIAARTFANPSTDALESRTSAWRKAELPAANGHGNARSVAQIHEILANFGVAQGQRFLSEETARSVMRSRISGEDLVLRLPMSFGLGFGLIVDPQRERNLCFWGGWGGSTAIIDQDNQLSISYVMNRMNPTLTGDERGLGISQAAFQAVRNLKA